MIMRQQSLARLIRGWRVRMKQKKKQIGIDHTREGIGHCRQPSGQVEGEQKERRGRRNGKKHQGAGEEPQHRHNRTSPFVRVRDWVRVTDSRGGEKGALFTCAWLDLITSSPMCIRAIIR
jgi:hypothetical protein